MMQQEATVQIRQTDGGRVIQIRDADGKERRIEVSEDGRVVTGVNTEQGEAITIAAPPAPAAARRKALPDGLVDLMAIIMGAVTLTSLGTPLVKAWARRFERKHEFQQQAQIEQRLAAIEQAIETVAVEVERISEGQRFTTKLLADRAPSAMEQVR